jgi:hypothetical protein
VLDFAPLNLAPGTRGGVVPDERFEAFARAVRSLEADVVRLISQREEAERERASKNILKQVHRAFANALRELPSSEYIFFDIPETRLHLGKQSGAGTAATEDGMALPRGNAAPQPARPVEPAPALFEIEPGPLARVQISPRHARRSPGHECRLSAVALDEQGVPVSDDVQFDWRIADGPGTLNVLGGPQCAVRSAGQGLVCVEVRATQNERAAEDRVAIRFIEAEEAHADDARKGLPAYWLEADYGQPWRSRYDAARNEIVINSAHRDFLASKATVAKHRRYIGKLYAKEVVLINFPHEPPAAVLERLVELTLRTEEEL